MSFLNDLQWKKWTSERSKYPLGFIRLSCTEEIGITFNKNQLIWYIRTAKQALYNKPSRQRCNNVGGPVTGQQSNPYE